MPIDTNVLFKAQPIDIAGAWKRGAESNQAQTEANTAAIEADRQKQDDMALREYLRVSKNDMSTAKGMADSLKDLQGRISPKSYLGLVTAKDTLQKSEDEHVKSMASMDEGELKRYDTTIETIMRSFGDEDITSDDPVSGAASRAATIKRLSEVKTPSGRPQFSPQALAQVADLPQSEFKKLFYASKHAKDLINRAHTIAKTTREEEQASFYSTQAAMAAKGKLPTGTENLYDPEGNVYANIPGKGILNLATQEPFGGDVATLKPVPTSKGGRSSAAGAAPADRYKQAADNIDFDKNPPTPVEYNMARGYLVSGKMDSLGQNSPLRPRVAALAAKIALDENIDVPGVRASAAAGRINISNLTKQYGVIKAGEETVLKNLDLMKPYLDKVDVTGVPVLERWIRAGKRTIAGDPDVAALDALITSTQADIGKVLSAATGAAGTPVEALKKAEKYFGGDMTKKQFDELYVIIPKEMDARTVSMEEQIKKSLDDIAKLGRGTKVASNEQKARDTDAVAIQRAELVKARQQVRDLKAKGGDPAALARAEADVSSIERELKRAGVTLDTPSAAPTAPAPKAAPKEGDTDKSKSGKPIIYRNGKWVYQ